MRQWICVYLCECDNQVSSYIMSYPQCWSVQWMQSKGKDLTPMDHIGLKRTTWDFFGPLLTTFDHWRQVWSIVKLYPFYSLTDRKCIFVVLFIHNFFSCNRISQRGKTFFGPLWPTMDHLELYWFCSHFLFLKYFI